MLQASFPSQWTETPMTASQDETGGDAFNASVSFEASQIGTVFQWGVVADIAGAAECLGGGDRGAR